MYDAKELRLRRELQQAEAQQAKLAKQGAALKQRVRAGKARLKAGTRNPTWHAHRIAAVELAAGAEGENSSGRHWLRTRPFDAYNELVRPFAETMPNASIAEIEVNLELWTRMTEGLSTLNVINGQVPSGWL